MKNLKLKDAFYKLVIEVKETKNKVKGKIEFNNVVFQYDGNDKPTINNSDKIIVEIVLSIKEYFFTFLSNFWVFSSTTSLLLLNSSTSTEDAPNSSSKETL